MSFEAQLGPAKRAVRGRALCALKRLTLGLGLVAGSTLAAAGTNSPVLVRFLDSATGYGIQPEVQIRKHRAGAAEQRLAAGQISPSGHAALSLEEGAYTIEAAAPGYSPVSGALQVRPNHPYQMEFLLDPLELPAKLRWQNVAARQRAGATLLQGFIVDDSSGQPVRAVRVSSLPSGVETSSDERGFFELYVPVPAGGEGPPANVVFEKPGYQAHERQDLELWSRGDWTYRIRLQRGGGREIVNERALRREMPADDLPAANTNPTPASALGLPGGDALAAAGIEAAAAAIPGDAGAATLRVPRNIRVEKSNIVYYVSMNFYCKHVLPHEWLASWNLTCLYAGSVPVRGYAIARINGRAPTSDFDICGTSSCQVFKPTSSSSSTDKAVDFTDGWVLINANGNIASTEYSAENNSLGKDCGDGFTAPSGGCLYDPICAGHDRSGHGRGMCQRGSQRWAIGANGFPVRDWVWIVHHYYPDLRMVKGTILLVGDDVRSRSSDCQVRACSGGGIESGTLCPLVTTMAPGQTGVIIGGPLVVTNDGKGFTWYQVRWNDTGSTTGWSCENYLERVFSAPDAPGSLVAMAVATNRIDLTWTDDSDVEGGFSVEHAPSAAGPWVEIGTVPAATTAFSDLNLYSGSTWQYRVRAFNAAGYSAYTSMATATTPAGVAPTLAPVHDETVAPGTAITITNIASAPERALLITDFEPFPSETANGVVLFRSPNFSSSTSAFLDAAPEMDLAAVTDTYPSLGHGTGVVLYVRCNFTNAANPWLRLTTSNTEAFGNPVLDFTRKLRFDVYADRAIQVGVGCRETATVAGTAIGSDGGTIGTSIEWAGVTNVLGTAPMPTRLVGSNTWTTLTFDFPSEPIRSFSGGNGVLATASGLGVLEHLAIVPLAGAGSCNLYLDNFVVLRPRAFTYTFGADAPPNASLDPLTGVFSWTPTPEQSPGTNQITIVVTDDSMPPLWATNTFTIVVKDSVPNSPPLLMPIANRTAYVDRTLIITNSAYDSNPGDALTFSLDPGAPPSASINPVTGVFAWTPAEADTNSPHAVTVRVTDSGVPQLSSTAGFSITVIPPPPPNQAPLLFPVANRNIHAGSLLIFTNAAYDPDGDALTFSLGSDAPAGAGIDPISGVFTWTPPDADSNTTRSISVRVTDDGEPPLSGSASFTVTVLPRLPNQAPVLSAINDRTVHAGSLIIFTNAASDADTGDALSFSLDDDAPAGAAIDTLTGVFSWRPPDALSDTTNAITVSVTDDGEPPLSNSASFLVTVRPRPRLELVSISAEVATLSWSAIPNVRYLLEYKNHLEDPLWQALGDDVAATDTTASAIDRGISAVANRFYRVQVLDDLAN